MAIILYNKAGMLPAGRLRAVLAQALPTRRWICGENDDGTPGLTVALRGHLLICGRGEGAPLFVELRCIDAPCEAPGQSLPPHGGHILLHAPTTEHRDEADLVTALVAEALMSPDAGGTWCRLTPDGGWLAAAAMEDLLTRIRSGETLAAAAALPGLPGRAAPRPAVPAFHHELPRTDHLPTLLVLGSAGMALTTPDWATISEGAAYCDPGGNWRIEPRGDGGALLIGRGGRIIVTPHDRPIPADWLDQAVERSFWLGEGQAQTLRTHAACMTIGCDIDTTSAGALATRQIAKVMAMVMLLLGQGLETAGHLVGLGNLAHALLFPARHMATFAQALSDDEVPVQLFIATAFHATTPGAVSLSTAGLMPFVGSEVEAWNAPGDVTLVGERLGNVLRYLLIEGPVLRHGDTLGHSTGDRAMRVLTGPSRAQRPYAIGRTIPALWLEFGEARPYPMRAPTGRVEPAVSAGIRRPGGFGRKGL